MNSPWRSLRSSPGFAYWYGRHGANDSVGSHRMGNSYVLAGAVLEAGDDIQLRVARAEGRSVAAWRITRFHPAAEGQASEISVELPEHRLTWRLSDVGVRAFEFRLASN